METKKKPLFIAFSSQKGGVGKSTFTTLVASTMHYRLGYNVVVFDADFPQHSLMKMKTRDLAMVMENEALKKQAIHHHQQKSLSHYTAQSGQRIGCSTRIRKHFSRSN